MELNLFIKQKLPVVSGTSAATGKTWRKQDIIGQTLEQFPKTVMFSLFGDYVDLSITEGVTYTVSLDIESRSYIDRNGKERWSTDVKVWKAVPMEANAVASVPAAQSQTIAAAPQVPQPSESLPF